MGPRLTVSLGYLIRSVDWTGVEDALRLHYPQEVKDMESFRTVFQKLALMNPEPTRCWFVIKALEPWPDPDCDEPYGEAPADVGCTDGSYCEDRKGEILYCIDFRPWSECLGMEVLEVTRKQYTDAEIAAHCLWEMTWHGFEEADGGEFFEELTRRAQAPMEDFITLDELMRRVDSSYVDSSYEENEPQATDDDLTERSDEEDS